MQMITVLGATGSIGVSTLDVVARHPDKYAVFADINLGILYLFAMSSLGIYGIIMSGWSSNSKYAFLGALRSTAQMVSYEVSIGFIIVIIAICAGSFNLSTIVESQQNT